MDEPAPPDAAEGLRVVVRGTVQGVGMRPFVHRVARAAGVSGRVRNDGRGVTIDVFGARAALLDFLRHLGSDRPPAARFDELYWERIPHEALDGFHILTSEAPLGAAPSVSIPADLATCAECLAELRDPANRRHRYPFTNCTNCGPRFTIARAVPYDRAATTMAPFELCAACAREYRDPDDRRFHAEPNACPACGPKLTLVAAGGETLAHRDAALAGAARALLEGRIVAVKGVGGFHLACDAGSSAAVRALRERKRREEKPLAVMPRGLAEAEALAHLGDAERALLTSVERPIVLVPRRAGAALAPEVAPDTPLVGLLLPYSPLHHLLLDAVGRPLVMTSGNVSEEPIAYRNGEALTRLAAIADLFLVHDREIEARADDSVARVVDGRPLVMRRSRGYVPRALRARRPFARPTLACGAQLKATFCLGVGDAAHLGPHVGDLDNLETLEAYEAAVRRMESFLRVAPRLIAHDLHPEYVSTRWALERARADGVPAVAVQHHHAHAAACMGEHGLEGPVLALTWDGTGLGTDGASWGGELLLARYDRFERLATFRPLPLPGGDRAVREPWRVALAALEDAFDGAPPLEALALFRSLKPADVRVVRQMIAQRVNAPLAHGAGRLFDAVGALALGRPASRYEGQVAVALDAAHDGGDHGAYPFHLDTSAAPWQLDFRPLVREVVADLVAGRPPAVISARFHAALAEAGCAAVRHAAARHGGHPVVLSGGCFQNARLVEGIIERLRDSHTVYAHALVPPGDGGLALGQALVADALARGAEQKE
jgi:hydrogenase maturation protein HypF